MFVDFKLLLGTTYLYPRFLRIVVSTNLCYAYVYLESAWDAKHFKFQYACVLLKVILGK